MEVIKKESHGEEEYIVSLLQPFFQLSKHSSEATFSFHFRFFFIHLRPNTLGLGPLACPVEEDDDKERVNESRDSSDETDCACGELELDCEPVRFSQRPGEGSCHAVNGTDEGAA
jgi:hypothetical protein